MEKSINYKGYTYWYEQRPAKNREDMCLATTDPEKYCNGFYLYSDKDPGSAMKFVVTRTNNPNTGWKTDKVKYDATVEVKATWLVEMGLFTDTEDRLIEAVKKSGRIVKEMKYVPFDDEIVGRRENEVEQGSCAVFYGSLNFATKLKALRVTPGVYLNENAFECTSYYPAFGRQLLHERYVMMPYGDLIRNKEMLFKLFGGGRQELFVRPNSGMKQFVGTVLGYDDFEEGIRVSGLYDVERSMLVLVSESVDILKEWRFVIVDGRVVSGSLYRDWTIGPETLSPNAVTRDIILRNSKSVSLPCTDDVAWRYARRMAGKYNPDSCWVMDVAKTASGVYRVIEIGCFSCAGMYGNNLDVVVEAVSEAAEKEWRMLNDPEFAMRQDELKND